VTLLGGLSAIVGYKRPGGFYWRARETVHDNSADEPDDEFLKDILNDLREDSVDDPSLEDFMGTDPSQSPPPHEEPDSEQQYLAFGEAFEQSRSILEEKKDGHHEGGGCSLM
jgi:hypothetical protein